MFRYIVSALSQLHRGVLICGGFALFMVFGALLLMLPFSTTGNAEVSFVDALFMSVSVVSVTGMSMFDVQTDFTIFGQLVILFLMQVGGLGTSGLGIGLHALLELGDDGLRTGLAVERLLVGDYDVLAGVLDLVQTLGQGGELVLQVLNLAVVRAVNVALLGGLDGVIGLNLGGVEVVELNVQILALGVELGHLGLELHIGLALGSELLELRHIGKFALVAGELQIDLLQLE